MNKQPISVLDHGFIRVIETMGNDTSIVQSARISSGVTDDEGSPARNRRLIRFLMKHKHTSPFEMCEIKFHIKLPLFVARQWLRHRTANVNEFSGRYSTFNPEVYIPALESIGGPSATNYQCTDTSTLDTKDKEYIRELIQKASNHACETYKELSRCGLSNELARLVLPMNVYTEIYWKIDLHNLFNFIRLRVASDAQPEIQAYARVLLDIVRKWVPMACEAFEEYVLHAFMLSREATRVVELFTDHQEMDTQDYELTAREWAELEDKFGLKLIKPKKKAGPIQGSC